MIMFIINFYDYVGAHMFFTRNLLNCCKNVNVQQL